MEQVSEYQKQGTDFLAKHDMEFRVVHIGNDCPTFCEDAQKGNAMDEVDKWPRKTHIHGHHYHVTISAKGRGHFTIDFWNSYADEDHNEAIGKRRFHSDDDYYIWQDRRKAALKVSTKRIEPTPYDVFARITKYDPDTFENFCAEYGYDTDSRKAEATYFAVQKEWSKVRRFFTAEELEELQEIS